MTACQMPTTAKKATTSDGSARKPNLNSTPPVRSARRTRADHVRGTSAPVGGGSGIEALRLESEHGGVPPAGSEQRLVCAQLHHTSAFQHADAVRPAHGGE